jgi:hypothetical protein
MHNVAPVPFKKGVCDRWGQFTSAEKLRVCIGTWNVNGGRHVRSIALKNQSTTDWLLDGPTLSGVAKEHVSSYNIIHLCMAHTVQHVYTLYCVLYCVTTIS